MSCKYCGSEDNDCDDIEAETCPYMNRCPECGAEMDFGTCNSCHTKESIFDEDELNCCPNCGEAPSDCVCDFDDFEPPTVGNEVI